MSLLLKGKWTKTSVAPFYRVVLNFDNPFSESLTCFPRMDECHLKRQLQQLGLHLNMFIGRGGGVDLDRWTFVLFFWVMPLLSFAMFSIRTLIKACKSYCDFTPDFTDLHQVCGDLLHFFANIFYQDHCMRAMLFLHLNNNLCQETGEGASKGSWPYVGASSLIARRWAYSISGRDMVVRLTGINHVCLPIYHIGVIKILHNDKKPSACISYPLALACKRLAVRVSTFPPNHGQTWPGQGPLRDGAWLPFNMQCCQHSWACVGDRCLVLIIVPN